MIILNSVSKEVGRGRFRKLVLEDISCVIPARSQLVILGQRGSGKSTLLSVLAGMAVPTEGWVERRGAVSVPGGLLRFALYDTPRKLIERISELYRADPESIINFTRRLLEDEDIIDVPVGKLPGWVRGQLNMALTYAFPCDFYLFDGSVEAGRKREFRDACRRVFEMRGRHAGTIVVTGSSGTARSFSPQSMGGVLYQRKLTLYERLWDAIAVFENLPEVEEEPTVGPDERSGELETVEEDEIVL